MKRWMFRIVLFLLLGAIINIAVAWGLGVTTDFRRGNENADMVAAAHRLWGKMPPEYWPDSPTITYVVRDSGVIKVAMFQPAEAVVGTPMHRFEWYQSGWPAYSMQGFAIYEYGAVGGFSRQNGVLLWFDNPINLLPTWPGFAINTLFYAAILWLIVAMPLTLRRHLRLKRGVCVKCKYPIGASDTCTECGKAIRKVQH